MIFDSLAFAPRLKLVGFTEAQAEVLADANRELLVPDLATKTDLGALKAELLAVIDVLGLRMTIDVLGLRMTIRLDAMIGVEVAILGAILRLH